ncbi:MAG: hypothetical protein OHK0029_22420 [Armatimonadaceae bacterium]
MKNQKRTLLALLALLSLPTAGFCQFDFDEEIPEWERFKLNPGVRVNLDFRNASVDAVIQTLSKASGIAIIKDPSLTGGITLQSPRPQSLTDAFAMLNAALRLRNFEMQKEGNFLVIRGRRDRSSSNRFGNMSPEQMAQMFSANRGSSSELRVYPIKFANATQVARVINEVFINSGNTQAPPTPVPGAPGTPPAGSDGGRGRGPSASPTPNPEPAQRGGFGGGGFGGVQQGGFSRRGFGGSSNNNSVVRASADDFSNSVIVNAPRREHEQVAQLIEQIDKQTEQPQQSRVFPLQFATAAELAPVVQNVLITNAPRGRGGAGSQSVPIEQRFQQAFRFGSAQTAFGQVVADARTNSLIVTDTQDNLVLVEKVIKELDKEVTFENSSFVLTLENARADEVATLLNQSFGGGRTGGNFGVRTTGNARNANANRNRNTTGNANPGGARGGPNAEDSLYLDLEDPDAEGGELATRVSVQQGFGGGRNRAQQQPGGTTGLNQEGRVVNLRDLTGQVVAIPDINTNSVIIVTAPENRAILEQILEQLDRIPEQVMIETLIVEASLDTTNKLGVEWGITNNKVFGTPSNGQGSIGYGLQGNTNQPQGLRYTLSGTQYSAFLQALQTDSRFDVLSTPRIFTSNNATAEINISQSLPYVLNQRVDANGNILFNYAFLDVGIILTVTPRITSNGYVTMDVTQTANDFVRYTEFNAPIVNQREAQTTVSVKDGETVVLGGVIRNSVSATVNKVPLLGDIPLLGNLFRSTETTKSKTELLVFLTPRVVRDENEARRVRERTQGQLQKKTQERILEVAPPATSTPDPNTNSANPATTPPVPGAPAPAGTKP